MKLTTHLQIKNEWSYTCTPPIRLQGANKANFYFPPFFSRNKQMKTFPQIFCTDGILKSAVLLRTKVQFYASRKLRHISKRRMLIDKKYTSLITYRIDLSMSTGIPPASGHNRHTGLSQFLAS